MAGKEESMYAPLIEVLESELIARGYDDFAVYDTHKGHFPPDLKEKFSSETSELISILALEPDICGYYKSKLGGYKTFHVEGKWKDIGWNGLHQARHDAELLDTDWAAVVDILQWKADMKEQLDNENEMLLTYFRRSDIGAKRVDSHGEWGYGCVGLFLLLTIMMTATLINSMQGFNFRIVLPVVLTQFLSMFLLWKAKAPIRLVQHNQFGRSGRMFHAILATNQNDEPIADLLCPFEPENPFEVFK